MIIVVAVTVWYLIAKHRFVRLIPMEAWILSIAGAATAICIAGLLVPWMSSMHSMASEFGNTVFRREGFTRWLDELIWIALAVGALVWSNRKPRRTEE